MDDNETVNKVIDLMDVLRDSLQRNQNMEERRLFRIKYRAATYSGVREVEAEDSEQAIEIVRSQIRREMTLPMYSESYSLEESS